MFVQLVLLVNLIQILTKLIPHARKPGKRLDSPKPSLIHNSNTANNEKETNNHAFTLISGEELAFFVA